MGPAEIDTSGPHPARTWDYYLGGRDNFAADRAVADKVIAAWPGMRVSARARGSWVQGRTADAAVTKHSRH